MQVRTDYFWTRNFIEHESYGDRKKNYQLKNTLIKSILNDIINDLKKSDKWKIQLTKPINFVSSKDTDEETNNAFEK